jgi:hypothetical protein
VRIVRALHAHCARIVHARARVRCAAATCIGRIAALEHTRGRACPKPTPRPQLLWTTDFSRCNNINSLLLGLWPSVSKAVKRHLVMQVLCYVVCGGGVFARS